MPAATAPVAVMQMPRLDHEALAREIGKAKVNADGAQIYSRAQARLEAAEKEREKLEAEQRDFREEVARCEQQIVRMNGLLETMKANEADVAVELLTVLNTIDTLRKAGVTL